MNDFVVSGQQKNVPTKKPMPVKRPVKSVTKTESYGGMIGDYMPLIIVGIAIYFIAKK
jgi:hypothetical protein